MVKIPRATPGDRENTIMLDKGQGHTRAGGRLKDHNNEARKQKSVKVSEIQYVVNK
jgi:hypothetical protein